METGTGVPLPARFFLRAQFQSVRFCFPGYDGYSSNSLARVGSMRSSITNRSLPRFSGTFGSIAKLLRSARPCMYQLRLTKSHSHPASVDVGRWMWKVVGGYPYFLCQMLDQLRRSARLWQTEQHLSLRLRRFMLRPCLVRPMSGPRCRAVPVLSGTHLHPETP
jgi:hypothetical protein